MKCHRSILLQMSLLIMLGKCVKINPDDFDSLNFFFVNFLDCRLFFGVNIAKLWHEIYFSESFIFGVNSKAIR